MFYEKNKEKNLSKELFKNPTSEYRGAPFWAWNCKLEKDELLRQIKIFAEMGFGGYHMHVRTGMATEYLSDEFMELIKACIEKGKEEEMISYLYDEDRWPSGAAGGIVTKEKKYRQKFILVTPISYEEYNYDSNDFKISSCAIASRAQNGELIACFDIVLTEEGFLKSYKKIGKDDSAEGRKWYVYLESAIESPWYNNQTYIDTLSKEAMDKFIDVTYEAYNKVISDDFGKSVPSIFTDEPQVSHKETLPYAHDLADVTLPWTTDLPETFKEAYGEDLISGIPELLWDLEGGKVSTIRYHYHDHVCERFVTAFADNCGNWCSEHGIALTGHVMDEGALSSQTSALGEAMRNYRGFAIPGIDMLCGSREFTTAKQTQSAVHQYGREAMLSELYGVTGWDFDFRGHKIHGDWQAALGVTLRVPHLSWVSMKGEAKRDYPASISYQSAWYSEYKIVEDHFARVNTALTRGTPNVNIGIIHPIESYWLHWGPNEQTSSVRSEMNNKFLSLTDWLVKGLIDFDYISESLLPELCESGSAPLTVGKMKYDVIIVPACETLRSTTLERLEKFKSDGGKLIFLDSAPTLENAVESDRGRKLYEISDKVQFTKQSVLDALDAYRTVKILQSNGAETERYCHQIRNDGESKWLFVAQAVDPYNKNLSNSDTVDIYMDGEYSAELYDTQTGEIIPLECSYKNGKTIIRKTMYEYDSLLILYTPGKSSVIAESETEFGKDVYVVSSVDYSLNEPNVLLLDMAEVKLDDGEFAPLEELLRADNILRETLDIPSRKEAVAQPWVIPPEAPKHTATLRFKVESEIDIDNAELALEDADVAKITLNGQTVQTEANGWYVDKSIGRVKLPSIKRGTNIIEVVLPFGISTNIEWCYLLGDFGVRVNGNQCVLCTAPDKLRFGDLGAQGLPFYGGVVTYHLPVTVESTGKYNIHIPHYIGGLITVENNNNKSQIVYPPYNTEIELKKGENIIDISLFGNRHNAFGCIHNADEAMLWIGPDSWRTNGDAWSYEYQLKKMGILSTPKIQLIK